MLQWTLGDMCLFQFWFPQGICLGVGLLGHMVVLFLVFKGISIPSSIVVVSIYIPTNSTRVGLFSPPSPSLVCRLFDDAHSDRCEVVSHCSFDLHFSNNEQSWESFHVFVSHLYVFFGEMSFRSFSTFWLGCLFFWYWTVWAAYIFWRLTLCQWLCLQLFSSIPKVVFSFCFDLHFSNNEQCWASVHVFVSHLNVFFGEMSVRSFSHFLIGLFVFLALSCMSCLYFGN